MLGSVTGLGPDNHCAEFCHAENHCNGNEGDDKGDEVFLEVHAVKALAGVFNYKGLLRNGCPLSASLSRLQPVAGSYTEA